jgi:hypothetical protein
MVRGWLPGEEWKLAMTQDWFHEVFKDLNGAFVWSLSPSPALARVAVDQLCEVKLIFPNSKHVLICPSLMTGYWRKQLVKLPNILSTIKENMCIWRKGMHEPLMIASVCPLLSTGPQARGKLLDLTAKNVKSAMETFRNYQASYAGILVAV